jgi:phosphatidylglycerophosphate synthase
MSPASSPPPLRYTVQDRSILLPYYKRFFVEPLLRFIPRRIHPNTVTHAGHLLNFAALTLLGAYAGEERRWVFVAAAVLVHAYLWCDNADGAHARRTGQCSATGEFLDHGLDLLNATYVACMTVVAFGALGTFWGFAAAVAVPAAAAVTYWEQAETGIFHLGLLNQIESICALTVVLLVRACFGAAALEQVGPYVLATVAIVALAGISGSAVRVARLRGRIMPLLSPTLFGIAVTFAAATGALGTAAAIVTGAAVFVFVGIRQLTLRVRQERPLVEHGVLFAALLLGGLAGYRALGGRGAVAAASLIAGLLTLSFVGLALARAVEGHREVVRLDTRAAER